MPAEYYPVKCTKCDWTGSSELAAGGHQIADTGDYDDLVCPECWAYVDDIEQEDQ